MAANNANNISISSVEDYSNLYQHYSDIADDDDEELEDHYKRIWEALRQKVWHLLFESTPTADNECLAKDLLIRHRPDACFHGPWDYNDWIVLVRDELLRRNMLNFWRDVIVKEELGTIWARDSDYFDNMYDTAPAEFYEHAGCIAPFPKPTPENEELPILAYEPILLDTEPINNINAEEQTPQEESTVVIDIAGDNPAADYTKRVEAQLKIDENDKAALAAIFIAAQQAIWDLLFSEPTLSETNFKKATDLLLAYRTEACFFAPMPYNIWLYKVRDELFKRKQFNFWQQVILGKKAGLCSYEDSDYFDDKRDKTHIEFYKSGDALLSENA